MLVVFVREAGDGTARVVGGTERALPRRGAERIPAAEQGGFARAAVGGGAWAIDCFLRASCFAPAPACKLARVGPAEKLRRSSPCACPPGESVGSMPCYVWRCAR